MEPNIPAKPSRTLNLFKLKKPCRPCVCGADGAVPTQEIHDDFWAQVLSPKPSPGSLRAPAYELTYSIPLDQQPYPLARY